MVRKLKRPYHPIPFMELHQPLISSTTTTTTTTSTTTTEAPPILRGLILLSIIAILAIWANHEASKGFDISIINDAGDTPHTRLFSLLFISNDEATRIVLRTSSLAHQHLHPTTKKKLVSSITVRLVAGRNPTQIHHNNSSGEYVIQVAESLMIDERRVYNNIKDQMVREIQRGVARVWLWDGNGGAPAGLVAGMAEVIGGVAGDGESEGIGCWRDGGEWEWEGVGEFLRYCEGLKRGFIGRLNEAMRDGWNDRMVDDALGVPAQEMCRSFSYYTSLRVRKVSHVFDDNGTHVS